MSMTPYQVMRLFDPEQPIYAQRPMQLSGLVYEMHDEIPWKDLEVDQKIVEGWFRLRMISHVPGGDLHRKGIDIAAATGPLPVKVETPAVEVETTAVEAPVVEAPVVVTPEKEKRKKK